jgi:hypothetical protein
MLSANRTTWLMLSRLTLRCSALRSLSRWNIPRSRVASPNEKYRMQSDWIRNSKGALQDALQLVCEKK